MIAWFKNFVSFAKIATIVISFAGGVAGGIVIYNKWVIDKHNESEVATEQAAEFIQMQQNFRVVIDSLSVLTSNMREIKIDIRHTNQRMDGIIVSNNNLREYMMKKAPTTDELLEIIRIWDAEKKKNNIGEIQ